MIKIERRENTVTASFKEMYESASYTQYYSNRDQAIEMARQARRAIKAGAGWVLVRVILEGCITANNIDTFVANANK